MNLFVSRDIYRRGDISLGSLASVNDVQSSFMGEAKPLDDSQARESTTQ